MPSLAPLQVVGGGLAALVVTGVLALGGGAALLLDAVRRIRFRRRASERFERVDATVVDSAVHEPPTGGGEAVPHVEYEYSVDGETYRSRRLWPTRSASPGPVDRQVARRVVEDHAEGAEVIARYDPTDPARSYLLEEFDRTGERVELLAGAVLVAIFLALAGVVVAGL